jgi:hypothetical protein
MDYIQFFIIVIQVLPYSYKVPLKNIKNKLLDR